MIVATVLKSGGIYNKSHVKRINEMAYKYIPHERFVCLTDTEVDCDSINLEHNLPGWWSKMELFKIKGPVLYLDLDTIVTGDMSKEIEAVQNKEFVILRDFYRNGNSMQSSIMYWSGDMSYVYDAFVKTMDMSCYGDQEYLEKVVNDYSYRWQDFTDSIVSFKVDVLKRGVRDTDKVIIFHGSPRPWEQNVITYN